MDFSSNNDELLIHPYLLTWLLLWPNVDVIKLSVKVRKWVFDHKNVKLDDPSVNYTSVLGLIHSTKQEQGLPHSPLPHHQIHISSISLTLLIYFHPLVENGPRILQKTDTNLQRTKLDWEGDCRFQPSNASWLKIQIIIMGEAMDK